MRSSYGLRHCQVEPWTGSPLTAEQFRHIRRLYPRLRSFAGHRVTGHVDLGSDTDLRYFTFVRDPLKSVASRFQHKVNVTGKDLVFEEWIQGDRIRNHQTKRIAGVDDLDEAIRTIKQRDIFVGVTERFDESLVLLKALVADDLRISYRPVNVARDRTLAQELLGTERTRQLLTDAVKVDLELYDYIMRELYPTYQREYGHSLAADVARFRETQDNDFDRWNLTLSRLKHYLVYKPSLRFLGGRAALGRFDHEA